MAWEPDLRATQVTLMAAKVAATLEAFPRFPSFPFPLPSIAWPSRDLSGSSGATSNPTWCSGLQFQIKVSLIFSFFGRCYFRIFHPPALCLLFTDWHPALTLLQETGTHLEKLVFRKAPWWYECWKSPVCAAQGGGYGVVLPVARGREAGAASQRASIDLNSWEWTCEAPRQFLEHTGSWVTLPNRTRH